MKETDDSNWDLIIRPRHKWYQVDVAAIWQYRDLLMLLVRRDFVAVYKQTILGPIWFFIQPIITSLTFTFIFGNLAHLSTDGNPAILFYLAGITLWTYFADCITKTSTTFTSNAGVFGKVYFPRLIMPLSILVSNLIKFVIQFLIFILTWLYFIFTTDAVQPQWQYMWLLPMLVFMMAGLGLGFGIFISSLTTKYRDLTFLVGFGVQLLMYASSVVLPISSMPSKIQFLMLLNPLTSIIEAFKFIFLGSGYFDGIWLVYGFSFMTVLILFSVIIFNKVEKSFMDTV
ncbi:MAG: ABC transporter permease [Sphingobacteriaceae bacterium]|nr:ABC transporter permease [Sphingobacteriaceae bacterium]